MMLKNDSGIILFATLWILIILAVLALGLGRQTSIELALARHAAGEVRDRYITESAMTYLTGIIAKDSTDTHADTEYQCGFQLDNSQKPSDLFKHVQVGSAGYFDVFYTVPGEDGKPSVRYGLQDEDGKINLNALTPQNYKILADLITVLGFDQDTAEIIASSVVDWTDADNAVFNDPSGAEDDYYMSLPAPYHVKNKPFESLEELLLVRGMTKTIFQKIRPFVTIYPASGGNLAINLNTAPGPVLEALARSFTGAATNTDPEDADSLVQKILDFRKGTDGLEATSDDPALDTTAMDLNSSERAIFMSMQNQRQQTSQFLHARVRAVDELSSVTTETTLIIRRGDQSLLQWQRP